MQKPSTPTDWERLYRQAQRLIETMPKLEYSTHQVREVQEWLARAYTLVADVNVPGDTIRFNAGVSMLATATWPIAAHDIRSAVFRAASVAESRAPEGVGGAFVNVGGHFEVFAALVKVFGTATVDVLLIDAYADQTALTDFAIAVPERVPLRLMADEAFLKPTLKPAVERWRQQYAATRPVEARLAPRMSLHDRAIFVDHKSVWLVSQSLNKIVARSPATITPADPEIGAAKMAAYEAVWKAASVL